MREIKVGKINDLIELRGKMLSSYNIKNSQYLTKKDEQKKLDLYIQNLESKKSIEQMKNDEKKLKRKMKKIKNQFASLYVLIEMFIAGVSIVSMSLVNKPAICITLFGFLSCSSYLGVKTFYEDQTKKVKVQLDNLKKRKTKLKDCKALYEQNELEIASLEHDLNVINNKLYAVLDQIDKEQKKAHQYRLLEQENKSFQQKGSRVVGGNTKNNQKIIELYSIREKASNKTGDSPKQYVLK